MSCIVPSIFWKVQYNMYCTFQNMKGIVSAVDYTLQILEGTMTNLA
jgi:hypothetical protein